MSKSLYSRVTKVYFRSYLLFNIVASSAYIGAALKKRIFTVASHLVMCIWDTLTAVDAPLFILFDLTSFETLHFWNLR